MIAFSSPVHVVGDISLALITQSRCSWLAVTRTTRMERKVQQQQNTFIGENELPNYQYRCPKCGIEREVSKPMTDSEAVICSDCQVDMNKVFGATPSIRVKGMSAR